jgi:hypothetical protein
LTARRASAAALAVVVLCAGRRAAAEGAWSDDEAVLAARRVRINAGYAFAGVRYAKTSDQTVYSSGEGLDLEEAIGIGHGLEVGARFGARPDPGRGTRADEVARGPDTETFGTGIDTWANPELRLRWRAIRWTWGEAGVEDRVVLPIRPSPDVTEVLGVWARLHLAHRLRVEAALNAAYEVQWLAGGRVLAPALGAPVQLWANVTRRLFVGLLGTVHHAARTPYTDSTTRVELGAGAGHRFPVCDLLLTLATLDVTAGFIQRLGAGLGAACHL